LRDTPAAPLSKNVKLMLWGSAAPVVLLFLAAMLVQTKRSSAKAPEFVVPIHNKLVSAPRVKHDDQAAAPAVDPAKPEEPKADAAPKPDNPPEQKPKPKSNKKKGKGKTKPKPPAETVVAQSDGDEKKDAKGEDSKDTDKDKDKGKDGDAKKPSM